MLVNAGALLVFPTLVDRLKSGSIDLSAASYAAICFVVGLVSAAMCGYFAYINFVYLAQNTLVQTNLSNFKAKCTPEMLEVTQNKMTIKEMVGSLKRQDCMISWTFYLGNFVGIVSLVLFCLGCFYVRKAILGG